jgi:hypothetical protein
MVCLPKKEGGLGVLQLERHNEALMTKKFTNSLIRQRFHEFNLSGKNITVMASCKITL